MKEERIIKTIEASEAREKFGDELMDAVLDFEKAKELLIPVLMKNTELYNDLFEIKLGNLPKLTFKLGKSYGDGGFASIPVTNKMIMNWEKDGSDMVMFACNYVKKNFLEYSARDLYTAIEEITDELPFPEEVDHPNIKVVTNNGNLFGANILLDASRLATILEAKINKSYLIIPSSIHEILVLDEEVFKVHALSKMIQEVNMNIVEDRDQLADFPLVLYFCQEHKKWCIK